MTGEDVSCLEERIMEMVDDGYEISFCNHPVVDGDIQIELRKDGGYLNIGFPKTAFADMRGMSLDTAVKMVREQFDEYARKEVENDKMQANTTRSR